MAALLRLRPGTIYQMVSQRRIPFRKAGRLLLFKEEPAKVVSMLK